MFEGASCVSFIRKWSHKGSSKWLLQNQHVLIPRILNQKVRYPVQFFKIGQFGCVMWCWVGGWILIRICDESFGLSLPIPMIGSQPPGNREVFFSSKNNINHARLAGVESFASWIKVWLSNIEKWDLPSKVWFNYVWILADSDQTAIKLHWGVKNRNM